MHPYVALARKAVEDYITSRQVLSAPAELSEEMRQHAGVFICMKKHGDLRGCIGTFLPTSESIFQEIVKNAIAAATEDPRFSPVQAHELEDITYTVDVLSPPEKVESLSSLDHKRYGVIVAKGYNKGLLLPDLEGVDTVDEQLRITKMKAGINPSDSDVEIFRFEVKRYK